MTSRPATERSPSSAMAEVNTHSPKIPPSEIPLPKTIIGIPPSSPVVEFSTPRDDAAMYTAKGVPDMDDSEPLRLSGSDNEGDDSLGNGDIIEKTEDNMVERTETTSSNYHTTEQRDGDITNDASHHCLTATRTSSNGGSSAAVAKVDETGAAEAADTCEPKTEQCTHAKGAAADSKVEANEEEDGQKNEHDLGDSNKRQGEETDGMSKDDVLGDDGDTAVEIQRDANAASAQHRIIPSHMRPTFKASNAQHLNSQDAKGDWPTSVHRMSRAYYPPAGYQAPRPPLDHDELRRMRAQLMKARNDLEVERKLNAEMRRTVGAEKQASISAAMSDMLTELLQKQAEALAMKAKSQEKDRELQYREQKIAQLEDYLSDGQKQLKYQLEQQGVRPMIAVDEVNLRREIESNIRHQFSNIEGQIAIQVERLRHQEATQKMREEQHKALIRDALETEIREQLMQDVQAKAIVSKATKAAYEHGLTEGKQTGGVKTSDATLKQEFLKGYAACYRSQTALHNLRNGHVPADSPDLAFFFDPTHHENPHNMGLSIGHMDVTVENVKKSTVGVVVSRKSREEGEAGVAAIAGEPQTASNAVIHRGRGQAQLSDATPTSTGQASGRSEQAHPAHQARQTQTQLVQHAQQEEPPRSSFPPRLTFASELRSSTPVKTPHGILASKPDPLPTPNLLRTTATLISNGATRASMTGRVGKNVYAERRTIRYDGDSDDEPASPNLIDLYQV